MKEKTVWGCIPTNQAKKALNYGFMDDNKLIICDTVAMLIIDDYNGQNGKFLTKQGDTIELIDKYPEWQRIVPNINNMSKYIIDNPKGSLYALTVAQIMAHISFNFDNKIIKNFISSFDKIELFIRDSSSPFVLQSESGRYKLVIMPLIIKQ